MPDFASRFRRHRQRGRVVRRALVAPIRRFLEIEAAAGLVLMAATIAALVWVNVGSVVTYERVFATHLDIGWAGRLGHLDLRDFIDDALMAVFFFVVGLEIKQEWISGSLADRSFARLPIISALGGMVVPAAIYVAVTAGTAASHGWGIPMATDIAFVIGVVVLLGDRVPAPIKSFLLALAIVDDLGAIVVIGVFYSHGVAALWLLAALAVLGVMVALRVWGVGNLWVYACLGWVVWYATWQSGVHATIAGVALAFITPMRAGDGAGSWSPVDELLERLHPWSAYVVIPLFALANAGVSLGGAVHGDGVRVVVGIVAGLVVGKMVGVFAFGWLAVKLRVAALPQDLSWWSLLGAGLLAGIGFTMSLFMTELAFDHGPVLEFTRDAKRAILAASVLSAAAGSAVFVVLGRRRSAEAA